MFATIATIRDKKLSGRRQAARLCLSSYSFDSTTRSVAAGFGRHGMPPPLPAANDTGTALGRDGLD